MSDTPRTDELLNRSDSPSWVNYWDFARQLERELAQTRAAGEKLAEACKALYADPHSISAAKLVRAAIERAASGPLGTTPQREGRTQ